MASVTSPCSSLAASSLVTPMAVAMTLTAWPSVSSPRWYCAMTPRSAWVCAPLSVLPAISCTAPWSIAPPEAPSPVHSLAVSALTP